MDLNASLRAVTADPPPTRINLDALIRAEERRGHRQRRLFGAGVVSGVAVVVGARELERSSPPRPRSNPPPKGNPPKPPRLRSLLAELTFATVWATPNCCEMIGSASSAEIHCR